MQRKPRQPKVTYRQEGGDDGYCYVVRVDGRVLTNGCTRRQAQYYRDSYLAEWRKQQQQEARNGH